MPPVREIGRSTLYSVSNVLVLRENGEWELHAAKVIKLQYHDINTKQERNRIGYVACSAASALAHQNGYVSLLVGKVWSPQPQLFVSHGARVLHQLAPTMLSSV